MKKNIYEVKLKNFEGPLDLLLHLIEKEEMDIYDIPISIITEQYIEYINQAKQINLDLASSFLLMAAELLSIKAKMLLPEPLDGDSKEEEEEIDPRDELVKRLLEYKKFKKIASLLEEKEEEMQVFFFRDNDEEKIVNLFPAENPLANVSLDALKKSFRTVLLKIKENEESLIINSEEILLEDCLDSIQKSLEIYPEGLEFENLFSGLISRLELVMMFIALLELVKNKKIDLRQRDNFGPIMIYAK